MYVVGLAGGCHGLVEVRQVAGHRDLVGGGVGAQIGQDIAHPVERRHGVQRIHLGGAAASVAGLVHVLGLPDEHDAARGMRVQGEAGVVVLEQHGQLRADAAGGGAVSGGVDLAGVVLLAELLEAEHLRAVHALDLQGGVVQRGLDRVLVEELGVRHLQVHGRHERLGALTRGLGAVRPGVLGAHEILLLTGCDAGLSGAAL